MSNRRKIEKALRALGAFGALVEFIRNRDLALRSYLKKCNQILR